MKYIFVLDEFEHTEFFTSYGGDLLNTKLKVPSAGFSVSGLDRTKLGVYQLQKCFFPCPIAMKFSSIIGYGLKFVRMQVLVKSILLWQQ